MEKETTNYCTAYRFLIAYSLSIRLPSSSSAPPSTISDNKIFLYRFYIFHNCENLIAIQEVPHYEEAFRDIAFKGGVRWISWLYFLKRIL